MAGIVEAGFYRRDFATEEEADEFIRELKGKHVLVQYNPRNQSKSTLSDASVESLLQARPPKPDDGLFAPTLDSVPAVLRPLLWPLVGLSVVGLVFSLWVHLGAVMGRRVAPEALFYILHVGIFVVWIPAVFVGNGLVGSVNRKDFWKVALKNSPDGMRYMVYIFFGYAFINFAFFFFSSSNKEPGIKSAGDRVARVFRTLDGVLFRRLGDSLLRGKSKRGRPPLRKRPSRFVKIEFLYPLRPIRDPHLIERLHVCAYR